MAHHRLAAWIIGAALAVLMGTRGAPAHEIPNDVRIYAFVKPAGQHLELLIRVPLAALIEVEFPTRSGGALDPNRTDETLRGAAKLYLIDNITVTENDAALPPPRIVDARISLVSDHSFLSYESARAHMTAPRLSTDDLGVSWNQQFLDVLLDYPIQSEQSSFAIRPRLDRFGYNVATALRFLPPDGAVRGYELRGDPGLVRLDPSWSQAALRFVGLGFWHILEGTDHLLFLACLVIPFRRIRSLVIVVTAFTVGHSLSLIGTAFGVVPDELWFPPLVETLIALTIVLMALDNIVAAAQRQRGDVTRRWLAAFCFGIIHGFGFSFALAETMQFAGDHLVTALAGFNLGVELGQIAALLAMAPVLALLFRYYVPEWLGVIILSALVAHTGWHWMLERGADLAKFPWPVFDAAFAAAAMRGLIGVLLVGALAWLANGWLRRWLLGPPPAGAAGE